MKNINGESCPEVRVPDVVIYKYRIPAYWYFTGSDGQLKRKNKTSIVNKKIAEFTKGAKTPQDVGVPHLERVSADGDGSPETSITYFDSRTLHEFLFHQQKEDDGCLQKFVWPKGAHNSMIQAWSPQICLLERRVNLHRLDSTRVPLQQRCCMQAASTCRRSRRCAAPPPRPRADAVPGARRHAGVRRDDGAHAGVAAEASPAASG